MGNYFFDGTFADPIDRVEAKEKVTGKAKYAAEYKAEGLAYGVLVTSTIAKGRISNINSKQAENAPGVITVLTHLNRPQVPAWDQPAKDGGADKRVDGQEFRVFFDATIHYDHQPVALVVANTLERAMEAANMVKVGYEKASAQTDISTNVSKAAKPKKGKDYTRGKAKAYKDAAVKVEANYTTPLQVHNPMETHAATVVWDKDTNKIIDYNKTQASKMAQQDIMKAFGLKEQQVQVISPFVGGAFGSSSRIWPQEMAALLAAKKIGRPVTVMARRDQVFNMVGYRPSSIQQMGIGATTDGTITGISHDAIGSTSSYEEFVERITDPTQSFYGAANVDTSYKLVPLDMSTPCWTRGPGETSGSFALESIVDELSYALKMDPMQLRLKNFAEKDFSKDLPWSTNYIKECCDKGAERFGWSKRNPAPRSMESGGWLLGMGMSCGIYHANRMPATASATLKADGSLLVACSVADTGPGSATIMTQIAADAFGIPVSRVQFKWGNSSLPPAPGQFGSQTTASVGSSVNDVVKALQQRLKELAVNSEGSAFKNAPVDAIVFENGQMKHGGSTMEATDALQLNKLKEVTVTRESKPGSDKEQFSGMSFCAHFVEVLVHPATGMVKMNRVVSAVDAGKIINKKTATNQVYGSIVWGIGIALMEEGIVDHRYGRYVNNNLADYHEPVNADIPPIEVLFIDKPDPIIDPMGAKGLGEIGLIGFTAAVANAVYHATGKRIRNLPITADKLL